MENEKVFVNAEMPATLAKQAGKVAHGLGISRSAIIRIALIDYLSNLKKTGAIRVKSEAIRERV